MRLIDADSLLSKFCVTNNGKRIPEVDCDNFPTTIPIKDVKEIILKEPTAYSVEKVVKELEEEKEFSFADFKNYARELGYEEDNDDWFYMGLWRAMQIVKAGGQND